MRLLAIGVFLVLTACAFVKDDTVETTLWCDSCREVQVTGVFDGDTVIIAGDRVVRLFGVDAPEGNERCAKEATERLRELAGGMVRLEDGPWSTDEFGRRTAYLYTVDGASIDELLIREGLVTASTKGGQHKSYLVNVEKEARTTDVGCLWETRLP